jgi:hypothetical protein
MPVSATTLALLMRAGLTGDALLEAVASIDADMAAAAPAPAKDSAADRRREWDRDRKAAQRAGQKLSGGLSTVLSGGISTGSPPDISKKESSPTPPKEKTTPLTQSPSVPSSSPDEAAAPKAKRATRLPSDWLPSAKNRDDALKRGVPESMIDRIAARFRDFWVSKAGKDGAKLDWDATWRNWCDRECEQKGWAPLLQAEPGQPATPSANGKVFVKQDSPQWWAWRDHRIAIGQRPASAVTNRELGADGWWFEAEWPPGALEAKPAGPSARAPPISIF